MQKLRAIRDEREQRRINLHVEIDKWRQQSLEKEAARKEVMLVNLKPSVVTKGCRRSNRSYWRKNKCEIWRLVNEP